MPPNGKMISTKQKAKSKLVLAFPAVLVRDGVLALRPAIIMRSLNMRHGRIPLSISGQYSPIRGKDGGPHYRSCPRLSAPILLKTLMGTILWSWKGMNGGTFD